MYTRFRRLKQQEDVMAKGQMRPNKEKKKPKAEHNKDKKKGGAAPPSLGAQGMAKPGMPSGGKS
jgi:hypothetical protein